MSDQRYSPEDAMAFAIAEARKGWGRVSPNPLVGCVIVDRDGQLLAAAHHIYENKGPHAEVAALAQIADKSRLDGAIAYVTLEPCSHHSENKKAPCCEVLAQYPFAKVVYGLQDPNPRVSGRGEKYLADHGIECVSVEKSDLKEPYKFLTELEHLTEHFLVNMREDRIFVAMKVATTADGFIADKVGPTKWITGEESREHVHYLRAGFDSILVGKNTFLKDDPSLNIRHPGFPNNTLKVIVADSKGDALAKLKGSRLYKTHVPQNIYWVVDDPVLFAGEKDLGINFVSGPVSESLKYFYKLGMKSVFVEGGAEIYSYFINNNLVDRLYHFKSPAKFAGESGLHWLEGFTNQQNPLKLTHTVREPMGLDFLFSSRVGLR